MMEKEGFEKRVEESRYKNKLNTIKIELNYPQTGINNLILEGIVSVYNYFYDESKKWEKEKDLISYFESSKVFFVSILEICVKLLVNNNNNNNNYYYYESNIESLVNKLKSKVHSGQYIFFYNTTETNFIKELYSKFPNSIHAAAQFLAGDSFKKGFDQDIIVGINQAYEFGMQDPKLTQRRASENRSILVLRDEFNDVINNAQNTFKKLSSNFIEEKESKKITFEEVLKEKESAFSNWFTETQEEFLTFYEKSKQSIVDNENLYKEKLKLEAPAKYWNERASKLKGEGKKWLIGLILCSIISISVLGCALYFISDGTLKDLFESSGSAIRWSVVFVTFVSFLAFAIRIFAKLTFSSYHLVRDAEEREQLAYVYLALKKEENIDDKERYLIMQSLFSRADSGLLKDDASPTMPGGSFIEKIMK